MQAKYTAGKWKVKTNWQFGIYTLSPRPKSGVEDEANANLIAAAPEMAEALLEAIHECRCSLRERESGHLIGCYAPKAIEALTKAGLL